MARWELADLATVGEIAEHFGARPATVANWAARHADFPTPLTTLGGTAIYSLRQVIRWHDKRHWKPGKHDQIGR